MRGEHHHGGLGDSNSDAESTSAAPGERVRRDDRAHGSTADATERPIAPVGLAGAHTLVRECLVRVSCE